MIFGDERTALELQENFTGYKRLSHAAVILALLAVTLAGMAIPAHCVLQMCQAKFRFRVR